MSEMKFLDSFVAHSNEALQIKLIRQISDLENDSLSFSPEMTHQIFGDGENIFGYKNLKIKLYYTADELITYLGITFSEKISLPGYIADDFLSMITKVLQPGYYSSLDDFSKVIANPKDFKPFGELINSFTNEDSNNQERHYEIYHVNISTPGFDQYHERLQTFILFYIDAASFLDIDDDRWNFFLVYEKYQQDGKTRYSIVGYTTIYHYYAYPYNIRPRISQMLILPPYQKQGLGVKLLNTIYHYYKSDKSVIDITVEDPSEQFQQLRDYVDVMNCKNLEYFNTENLNKRFTLEGSEEIRKELKLCKKQMRRVYEILKLRTINLENKEEYQKYRLEIKNRLNVPFQREAIYLQKLLKVFNIQEIRSLAPMMSQEQRLQKLEKEYREIETQYQQVLKRVEASQ